jgi:hypothetical protein
MTITSEITQSQTNLANSYTACQNKGATMPASQNFNNLATCITSISSGGDAVWGSITGTLSNQTDLQTALNAKQDTLTAGSNITITNNVISATGGGGTVDQTYNASSTNAQSGVAIAGAGFLQNQATGSAALAIGENTANNISGTVAIGNNATVSDLSAIAIGTSTSSSGGIAIGNETHAGTDDIIIGNNVLSSQIPDRVGANPVFAVVDLYNSSDHAGFALVDLMTGKIPNARINGVSGSFTTNDGKTITVTNGVITNIS